MPARLLHIALSLLWVAAVAVLIASPAFYVALCSAYFAFTLIGVLIIDLTLRPRWLEAELILLIGVCLTILDFKLREFAPMTMAILSFLGLASLFLMGLRGIWAGGRIGKLAVYGVLGSVLFLATDWISPSALALTEAAHRTTLDLYLYSFDASVRIPFSFGLGAAFGRFPWVHDLGLCFYVALSLPLAVVFAGHLPGRTQRALQAGTAFLVAAPLAVFAYNLFPAIGPVHMFGSTIYPWHEFTAAQARRLALGPVAVRGYMNAMPSMHMTWALLALWYSRGLNWPRRGICWVFAAFTVLATLGTGEHYFADLVVAFPFALLIESLATWSLPLSLRPVSSRDRALAAGLGTTAAWLLLLRFCPHFFWLTPAVPWILVIATVGGACWLHMRLQRAVELASLLAPAAQPAPVASVHA